MSESTDPSTAPNSERSSGPSANLPPVEPPSAGFLMQLFVVPMVIVTIIIFVCLTLNWLAHLGTNPEDLVNDLTKLNPGSWQKALTIANMLCDQHQEELRRNPQLAGRIAEILDEQIEAGDMEAEQIKLRVYLCLALGVFEIDEGLPTLIKAASVQRDLKEIEVRKSALEAISRQADAIPDGRELMRQDETLMDVLTAAARQQGGSDEENTLNGHLRARAAYAMGVIGGETAMDQLAILLGDSDPMVRFNAATALARYGDTRCIGRLTEMLDPDYLASSDGGEVNKATSVVVLNNALEATTQFVSANESSDLTRLQTAVEALIKRDLGGKIQLDAKLALQALEARAAD